MTETSLASAEALTNQQLAIWNRQLSALHRAALAIAAELSLEKVLKQIVDSARDVADAQYAAVGVPNAEGQLETFVHSGMPTGDR
ncbi:MAG: hypothetical protein M5U34_29750 [Chloroflexi bacterium]|nr:hypothetical protein [Chloroflexota bacterium]